MEVVDVRRVDQAVHRRVDRRGGAAAPVQAEVERRDHLVLALHARVHVDESAESIEPEDRETRFLQGPEVAAGALDPEQVDRLARDRIYGRAFGGGVATGVVRIPGVSTEAVGTVQQRRDGSRVHRHAPHPAAWPPTRSATMLAA